MSLLGDRPSLGIVYLRGRSIADGCPPDIRCYGHAADDVAFLENGMTRFLEALDKKELLSALSGWAVRLRKNTKLLDMYRTYEKSGT